MVVFPFFLAFLLCSCCFMLSLELFVDVPLIFSCQPDQILATRIVQGMVEARSVSVKNMHTHETVVLYYNN